MDDGPTPRPQTPSDGGNAVAGAKKRTLPGPSPPSASACPSSASACTAAATKRARSASLTLATPSGDGGGGALAAADPPSRPASLSPPAASARAPAAAAPLPTAFPPSRRTLARRARAAAAALPLPPHPPPPAWPSLVYAWASALGASQPTTPLLACHLWRRARGGLDPANRSGAPLAAALAACLWVAAKHEEARATVPAASAVAGLARAEPAALRSAELAILAAVGWRPLDGWVVGRSGGSAGAIAVA